MLKIRALNRESSSDEDFPVIRKEAQEEIALELYNKALRLQSTKQYEESIKILQELVTENIPLLENHGGLPHSMSTLKYSCFLNIGNNYFQREDYSNALDNYLNASELDATDVTLWYKIGELATKENRFRQATYAYSKGLDCSESHWPCLDKLITLLYAMRDTIPCLVSIGKALILDSDYTKGLVFRKQIYKDNPATKEYYQLYNPDYVWEPPLNVEIDADEEQIILNDGQKLRDHINEIQKLYEPKPLQTIPLPKGLEDYTWVSLGLTITHLHQFITDNNMSHFTMVDINKCMSQSNVIEEPIAAVIEEEVQEKPLEVDVNQEKPSEIAEIVEEKVVEDIVERRPSQNSENNTEGPENTPVQTDNDEEQVMEQDGDDQEDNSEIKSDKNRSINKSNKRKRDLVSELQIWGWHSKRKSAKKGKSVKDLTVEDALNRIIPNNLLKNKVGEQKYNQNEDSMNTMDLYNMYMEDRNINFLSPIHSPKSVNCSEEYFSTEREKEDVLNLWFKRRNYCDAIVLVKDFVITLSKLWHIKWPTELIQIYLDAYNMFREHYDPPQFFCDDMSFVEMRDDALATLLYGELLIFSCNKPEAKTIHSSLIAFLQLISGWQENWKEEFPKVFSRVHWLRTHVFRKDDLNDLAITALELIQEVINEEENKSKENFILNLPNCLKCGIITNEIVTKLLKHLDMITSLSYIEELYNSEKYAEVAEIMKLTFKNSSGHPICGRMGRPANLAMLLHSLWFTNIIECFIWTEECLYEALTHFLKPTRYLDKWEKILEKCLAFLYEIIKMETVIIIDKLTEEKRARLVETLTKIICKQINSESLTKIPLDSITPWILLHYILLRDEHRQQANKKISHIKSDKSDTSSDLSDCDPDIPPSIAILFSGHEFLGPKGWCLTGNGELLHFMLDVVLEKLDTPIFEGLREKIDIHIEQALFCLYQHPSKKNKISRHLADHNVDPLPLTWQRAFQLYEFYGPDILPEFNSYKNASISADLEQLFQRIIALAPTEHDPQPHITDISEYIHGKNDKLPESITFPYKIRPIYYLIGDYYFKDREFNRCIKYFLMDLCINPLRVDSWACIALSYLSQLENKLNYCKKLKNEMEFLDLAKCAQMSFKRALELVDDHIMLWIEFGSFEYMVHSFCSRLLKHESDTLSMEKFEYLENQKDSYLESSGNSFEKAIQLYQADENEPDERWLQYYILGKIAEKKQKEPNEYLGHYVNASKLLHENNATYPDKINYQNPQHLSVEALEMHFRINASILKYLEVHEGKEILNSIGKLFKECLDNSVFPKKSLRKEYQQTSIVVNDTTPETTEKLNQEQSEQILNDVKNCMNDILTKVDEISVKEVINIDDSGDVIMIDDSDDEQQQQQTEDAKKQEAIDLTPTKNDVQDLFDKMMQETMKKNEEQQNTELDSDTSERQPTEIKPELQDNKPLKLENDNKKNESETDENIRTSVDDSSSTTSSSSSSSSSSDSDSDDDSSSSSSTSSSGTVTGAMSNSEILIVVDQCITGLEQCIIRFPQNYKALYRLAHLYFNYKLKKDLNKCKQLLLSEYTCKGGIVVGGLFADRKIHNFFNGIWRIPSSEIDRPGSLSAHMSRCITLLLEVLRATNDHKLLLDLCMQFRKTPDPDKVYIKDSERLQFAEQSMTMCVQCLRNQIKNIPNMNSMSIQKLLNDIYRSYQRVQKYLTSKESLFSTMLTDVYKKFKKDKIPDNVNVMDLATKFCQQNRIVEKQKQQIQSQSVLLKAATGVTNTPVLPAPSTISTNNQTLKRPPGMGRPRGRPPLPKIPGQIRQSRGKNSSFSNPYGWGKAFDQNATYSYLKRYQDELIKQYSQNLSMSQLAQLSQYFTHNQYSNAFNQFVQSQYIGGQNPLLNPNLLSQFSNPHLANLDNLSKPNSGVKRKTDSNNYPVVSSSNGTSLDSLKTYGGNLGQLTITKSTTATSSKKNLPHTITSASQSTTISKVKSPTTFINLPHNIEQKSKSAVNLQVKPSHSLTTTSNIGKPSYSPKLDMNLPSTYSTSHVTRPSSSPTIKLKGPSSQTTSNNSIPSRYSTADVNKIKSKSITKTTASSQVFKEPSIISQAHSNLHHGSSNDKTANILMKDRPNISITPVIANSVPLVTTSTFPTPVIQTSPGKTLQEKLADKQKQHSVKHLSRNIEAEIIKKDLSTIQGTSVKKNLIIPSIPASLTVSKATTNVSKHPLDSGFSISQIPVTQAFKLNTDSLSMRKRDENILKTISRQTLPMEMKKTTQQQKRDYGPQSGLIPTINLSTNRPLSLSISKKPTERKPSSDDDVIFIE